MNDYTPEDPYIYGGCFPQVAVMFVVAIVVATLCSCKSSQVTVVERVRTDTCYISKEKKDSIYVRDSVFLHEYTKGDTIYVEKTRVNLVTQERLRIDTVYKVKLDSVPVPYPVVKEVNRLTWWQEIFAWAGGITLFVILAAVVIKLFPFKLS